MFGSKCYIVKKLFKSTHVLYQTKCLLYPKLEFDVKNASFTIYGHFSMVGNAINTRQIQP